MAFIPCEWYYENVLGDSCNNKCDECFGDKDIRVCKEDFEVCGETILDKVTIKKGSWWSLLFINNDHVLLDGLDGHQLTLKRSLFDSYFENFVYRTKLESEE